MKRCVSRGFARVFSLRGGPFRCWLARWFRDGFARAGVARGAALLVKWCCLALGRLVEDAPEAAAVGGAPEEAAGGGGGAGSEVAGDM